MEANTSTGYARCQIVVATKQTQCIRRGRSKAQVGDDVVHLCSQHTDMHTVKLQPMSYFRSDGTIGVLQEGTKRDER